MDKHPAVAVAPLTYDVIENDARILHLLHFSGLLIQYLGNPAKHAIGFTAEWDHFRVEPHTAIFAVYVQRGKDFFVGLDAHELTRLQIQYFLLGVAAGGMVPVSRGNKLPPP